MQCRKSWGCIPSRIPEQNFFGQNWLDFGEGIRFLRFNFQPESKWDFIQLKNSF